MKNRKLLLALLLVVVLAGGAIWAYMTGLIGSTASRLAVYYPKSTGFYVELDAKNALGKRLLTLLRQRAERAEKGSDAESLQGAVARHFNDVLEPYFSLGVWPDPNHPESTDAGEILAAIPLKEPLSLEEVLARLEVKDDRFKKATYADVTYLIEPETQTSLAVVDGNLLLANSSQALVTVLTLKKDHLPTIYDDPLNKKYVARLSARRDGTFILNNTAYVGKASVQDSAQTSQVRRLAEVVPLTVGAIDVEAEDHIGTEFITPVLLEKIDNQDLRKDLQAFYGKHATLRASGLVADNTTLLVEATGLDALFDVYRKYFMNAEQRQRVTGLAGFLQLAQIDFRQDIIGLLEGGTILAATPMQPVPTVMLENTESKTQAIEKLSGFLEKSDLPVEQKTEQIGTVAAQTVMIPSQNFSMTYGNADGVFVVAPTAQFSDLAKVWNHSVKSLKDNNAFQALTKGYPAKGNLFVYVDMQKQRDFIQQHLGRASAQGTGVVKAGMMTMGHSVSRNDWVEALSATLRTKSDGANSDVIEGRLDFRLTPESEVSARAN